VTWLVLDKTFLNRCIIPSDDFLFPSTEIKSFTTLSKRVLVHLKIALFSVGMYATIKAGGSIKQQQILIKPNLTEDISFISQLLKFEFVYQDGGLEENIAKTMKLLTDSNVVMVGDSEKGQWVTLSDEERRIGRETFDFYCFLLWPFIET
jgi:Glycerol-3-phosphate acyltransferase C-terminal region